MAISIEKVLAAAPQVKKDGTAFVIPEEVDATAFVALGHEVLQIPRICRIELRSEVVFVTHKGERFFFSAEQVVGFRFGGADAKARPAGAGFFKT